MLTALALHSLIGTFSGLHLAITVGLLFVFGAVIAGQTIGPDTGITDLAAALAAANGGGDSFVMTGKDLFVANNASGGSITITFVAVADNFGVTNAVHNLTLVLAAGKIGIFGPSTLSRFRDANGLMQVTYSGVTSLTVGVLRAAVTA